jgi:hypothetical protein
VSISSRCTKLSRVCGTQLIFGAMDSTAAHSDGYSLRCSCTMRTVSSRTAGENLLDLFRAQFSQVLEPPQNCTDPQKLNIRHNLFNSLRGMR